MKDLDEALNNVALTETISEGTGLALEGIVERVAGAIDTSELYRPFA